MFKRVLTRKNKKKGTAQAATETVSNQPIVYQKNIAHSAESRSHETGTPLGAQTDHSYSDSEPPGFKRNTSPGLLKAALNQEIKERSLSAKSQARLDLARWRSNGSCAYQDSELVIDTLGISKSRLAVRTQGDIDDETISTLAEILSPSSAAVKRGVQGNVSTKRNPAASSHAHSSSGIDKTPCVISSIHLMRRPSGSDIPFDEVDNDKGIEMGKSEPIDLVSSRFRSSGYESILDGPCEEGGVVVGEINRKSHNELPDKTVGTSMSSLKLKDSTVPEETMNRHLQQATRSVSFAQDSTDIKKWRFGKSALQNAELVVEEPESNDSATFCGWCFDSSCIWMFGEPTDVLDRCSCTSGLCACGNTFGTKGNSIGYDSVVETCSSSDDSTGKKDSQQPVRRRLAWLRRRSRPKEVRMVQ